MIDLKKVSGINLKFDERKNVLYLNGIKLKPSIRFLSEMKDVLCDAQKEKEKKLYFMFRDVSRTKDFAKFSLRYDVTIIPALKLGSEYNLTYGHYHPLANNNKYDVHKLNNNKNNGKTSLTYPEVYQVLHGTAFFMMQKLDNKGNCIDVVYVIAKKGDKVLMLPNYGHISVNASDEPLVLANLVNGEFQSDYAPIKKMHGAAYYVIEKNGKQEIVANPRYKNAPELRGFLPFDFKDLGLSKKVPLFLAAKKNVKQFEYLSNPNKFVVEFKKYAKQAEL